MVKRKEWEKEVPIGIADALGENKDRSSSECLRILEKEDLKVLTPVGRIREIARSYSKKHKIPVRINEGFFKKMDYPHADAIHSYYKGKSVIYLHPILKYYPEKYIRGCIEHELDHARVEQKWEEIL